MTFKANSYEDRNKWYHAMCKAVKDNEIDSMGYIPQIVPSNNLQHVQEVGSKTFKPESNPFFLEKQESVRESASPDSPKKQEKMTLNDIIEFLEKEDENLRK